MAATAVAQLMRIRKETIRESLSNFQGVEHRLEKVLKIQNVQYINDSKATNTNATFFAFDSMTTPTVWIVGGVDKGNDYDELMPLVREKVKAIVCLGVDNQKIVKAFGNVVDIMVETSGMQEAVKVAEKLPKKGIQYCFLRHVPVSTCLKVMKTVASSLKLPFRIYSRPAYCSSCKRVTGS